MINLSGPIRDESLTPDRVTTPEDMAEFRSAADMMVRAATAPIPYQSPRLTATGPTGATGGTGRDADAHGSDIARAAIGQQSRRLGYRQSIPYLDRSTFRCDHFCQLYARARVMGSYPEIVAKPQYLRDRNALQRRRCASAIRARPAFVLGPAVIPP